MSIMLRLPPRHSYPASTVQLKSHPSPLITLLSSHAFESMDAIRLPSPHTAVHSSMELGPSVDRQAKPSSIMHDSLQPSPLSVLLSSQSWVAALMPSPQICSVSARETRASCRPSTGDIMQIAHRSSRCPAETVL